MKIKDLPLGTTIVTIVYVETESTFIGKLANASLIAFEFKLGLKVKVGDCVTIIKREVDYVVLPITLSFLPKRGASS